MYTIIASMIFCSVIGGTLAVFFNKERECVNDWILRGLCIGAVVGTFVSVANDRNVPRITYKGAPVTLVAVHSSEGASGIFVWGSGSVEGSMTYHFMTRNDDGSYSPASVAANSSVRIVEDKNLTNVGYWTTTYKKIDETSSQYFWSIGSDNHVAKIAEELRVPVGTVQQGFNIK